MGEQVWERAVGVAHGCHEERHHPAGEDGYSHVAEDNPVDHEGVDTVVDEHSIESTAAIALAFLVLSYYPSLPPSKMFTPINRKKGIKR